MEREGLEEIRRKKDKKKKGSRETENGRERKRVKETEIGRERKTGRRRQRAKNGEREILSSFLAGNRKKYAKRNLERNKGATKMLNRVIEREIRERQRVAFQLARKRLEVS